jgi:hypothetical protein
MCSLPSGTMPAASNRSTVAQVVVLTRFSHIFEPPVVMRPSISHRSLKPIGRPCSGDSGIFASRALSAAAARACASSS